MAISFSWRNHRVGRAFDFSYKRIQIRVGAQVNFVLLIKFSRTNWCIYGYPTVHKVKAGVKILAETHTLTKRITSFVWHTIDLKQNFLCLPPSRILFFLFVNLMRKERITLTRQKQLGVLSNYYVWPLSLLVRNDILIPVCLSCVPGT